MRGLDAPDDAVDGVGVGMADGPVGVLAVDTAELEELCGRLRRTSDAVVDAGQGVRGLQQLGGLGVGADAVLDALSDLVRQWGALASGLDQDVLGLALQVEQARTAYESCEGRVAGAVCISGPAADAR